MLNAKWISMVQANATNLRNLIAAYHPANLQPKFGAISPEITAPNAEVACEQIRNQIRKKSTENPVEQYDAALAKGDVDTIGDLLSSAWFGVPESTDCWCIPGFAITVELLDDPPDEDFVETP